MFGKPKYEYTNPDVIHLIDTAKRKKRNIIVGNLLAGVTMIGIGHILEKYQDRQLDRIIAEEAEAEAKK